MNNYIIEDNLTILTLKRRDGNNFKTKISLSKLNKLIEEGLTWYAKWSETAKTFYVCASRNGITYYLHRFLLDINSRDIYVDHFNHDTFDNTDENLRVTTNSKNNKHRKGKNINNTSGHRNVTMIKGYWRVQLQIGGKNHMFLEKFTDADLAGEFAEKMRYKYYSEYAGEK